MKLSHDDQHELTVLTLQGELASDETDRFRRAALERIDARIRDFVLDLNGLEGIDSQGLESLLWLQEQCDERLGQVRLAGCQEHVSTVLKMTRLDNRFECCEDVESAIESLG
ncbi:MAG: STAS domain-containing protein [Planctomycetota bacterium]